MIRIAVIQLETRQKKPGKQTQRESFRYEMKFGKFGETLLPNYSRLLKFVDFFCVIRQPNELHRSCKAEEILVFRYERALKNRRGIAKVSNIAAKSFRMQISRGKQSGVS